MKDILIDNDEQQYSNEFRITLLDFISHVLLIKDRTTAIQNRLLDLIEKKSQLPSTRTFNEDDDQSTSNCGNGMIDGAFLLTVVSSSFKPIRCIGFINRFQSITFVPTWLRSVREKPGLFPRSTFIFLCSRSTIVDFRRIGKSEKDFAMQKNISYE